VVIPVTAITVPAVVVVELTVCKIDVSDCEAVLNRSDDGVSVLIELVPVVVANHDTVDIEVVDCGGVLATLSVDDEGLVEDDDFSVLVEVVRA
jgi:hypothetical protein